MYDTNGEWVRVELIGETSLYQDSMTVMARLGGYSAINTGTAWFDDFTVERLDAAPEGVVPVSFASLDWDAKEDEEPSEKGTDFSGIIAGLFLAALIGLAIFRSYKGKKPLRAIEKRDWRLRLTRMDALLIAGLTVLSAATAFTNLGSTSAPETRWTSRKPGDEVVFDLGEVKTFHMTYYGGICDTSFLVEFSDDGFSWTDPALAEYRQGLVFMWRWFTPSMRLENGEFEPIDEDYPMQTARYVRISSEQEGMILSEVGFIDENGQAYPVSCDVSALVDEQSTIPPYPTYMSGAYFDEIYHARTAFENIHGLTTYETTHPPLGKLLIAIGVNLFGMTPFGWRFMGALVGVLMVPMMYLLAKQLLERTDLSFVAAFLMAADLMHFTQTRIATIDTYPVFFIMIMYFFMLRYAQMDGEPLKKTLVPLGLSGLFMGFAIASKWIGLYAAVGLAVLLLACLIRRVRAKEYGAREIVVTLACCCGFFIVIPALIYFFSYYWQLVPVGKFNLQGVIESQEYMLWYHSRLKDPHFFQSKWYQWPVIGWPMWYFDAYDYLPREVVSSISLMGNPVVFWGGAVAMAFVLVRAAYMRERESLFITIAFLSQYLPWVLVPRSMFIYHYFAAVPFVILATVYCFDLIRQRYPKVYKWGAIAYCTLAAGMFAFFYPVASGHEMPRWYAEKLKWFNWVNFR